MGGFSLWHWIILFLMIAVPALVVGLIVWLIVRLSRRKATTLSERIDPAMTSSTASHPDVRLRQLQDLKEQGLVSHTEYEEKRAQILDQV